MNINKLIFNSNRQENHTLCHCAYLLAPLKHAHFIPFLLIITHWLLCSCTRVGKCVFVAPKAYTHTHTQAANVRNSTHKLCLHTNTSDGQFCSSMTEESVGRIQCMCVRTPPECGRDRLQHIQQSDSLPEMSLMCTHTYAHTHTYSTRFIYTHVREAKSA